MRTEFLDIACLEAGDPAGWPVILLHGFPYDVHCYDDVAGLLAKEGARLIIPWLRGYGPTRFLSEGTPRSGEQAALGADLLALMDALGLGKAILGGFDWGSRAACVAAALWPERVAGLVSVNGYNIQDIARSASPAPPRLEHRYWYQYYLHGERGRQGLNNYRRDFCRLLWTLWSPDWNFDEAVFERSLTSFGNPDFVEVVVHSYRHRFGLVAGDPRLAGIEQALAARPPITIAAVTIDGASDGVADAREEGFHKRRFTGPHHHTILPGIGHNVPQEAPTEFAAAILMVRAMSDPASGPGRFRPKQLAPLVD